MRTLIPNEFGYSQKLNRLAALQSNDWLEFQTAAVRLNPAQFCDAGDPQLVNTPKATAPTNATPGGAT